MEEMYPGGEPLQDLGVSLELALENLGVLRVLVVSLQPRDVPALAKAGSGDKELGQVAYDFENTQPHHENLIIMPLKEQAYVPEGCLLCCRRRKAVGVHLSGGKISMP